MGKIIERLCCRRRANSLYVVPFRKPCTQDVLFVTKCGPVRFAGRQKHVCNAHSR
jgi:hypothetical protein